MSNAVLKPINHDRNPFDLYQSEPGWKEASIDIEAVINAARNHYFSGTKDADTAFKEVSAVLRKYKDWGALDSEPQWAAARRFCKGTNLDPSDYYGV